MNEDLWSESVTEWAQTDATSRPSRLVCVLDDDHDGLLISSAAERLGIEVFPVHEDSWMTAYGSPIIVTGTHDEVFSRALNRGYGVRPSMRNVQFGLLNNDCMWIDGTGSELHAALADLRRRFPTFRARSVRLHANLDSFPDIPIHALFGDGSIADISEFMREPCVDETDIPAPVRKTFGTEWVALPEHLSLTERFVCDICPDGVRDVNSLKMAARYHDYGKSHRMFQEWLLEGVPQGEYEMRRKTTWAKRRPRTKLSRIAYRHDVAGACAFLHSHPEEHLAAYLIMSHHGKFRSGIPDVTDELPKTDLGGGIVTDDVSFVVTSERWKDVSGGVYKKHGPFLLSYYEAILRISDMLASDS